MVGEKKKYKTLSGGVMNRKKALTSTITEMTDSEMVTFLCERAENDMAMAMSEHDITYRKGLIDDAKRFKLIAARLSNTPIDDL